MTFRTREAFQELIENSPDAQLIVDEHGLILYANRYAHSLFGYEPESLHGLAVEQLMPAQARAAHVAHRTHYVAQPQVREMGTRDMTLRGLRRDGTEFSAAIRLAPLKAGNGFMTAAVVRDVTETEQLMEVLACARTEADAANDAKSRFLAAASHDLRQPLQTLNLLGRVLEKTVTEPAAAVAAIARQREALSSVTELLNALLDISKLESGAIRPDVTDCSVQTIFRRLRSMFELQAQAKGLEMLVEECDDSAHTDPGLLEQMLQNLVANAIRYTQKGMVTVRCLHLQTSLRLEVLDTGIGIPEEQVEAIFEDFYQVKQDYGEKREGLGLGLSIVRRLGRLLDHAVEVRSEPGGGSCFSVTVPKSEAVLVEASNTRLKRLTFEPRRGRILLVDDEPAVASATRLLLEVEGHAVMLAAGIDEAERLVAAGPFPDLIVSDFHLSREITGADVVRQVRSLTGREIPAIFVTGDTSSSGATTMTRLPCSDVLSKPVDADELLSRIQLLLQH